ncbi:class I SAM-dependent methyltransferase [Ensifer sp. 22564]|uniref:class I SAM-dependent methyltransferase n=1 Tax=Ensifer sp. 22564 TaxID=3453943 RepID=UPI003F85EFCD
MLEKNNYWDGYYQQSNIPTIPSQFAVFVAGVFEKIDFILDFGCGNGRDTDFFLNLGNPVLAVDRSIVAINQVVERHQGRPLKGVATDIDDIRLSEEIGNWLESYPADANGVAYARFFLHAVDEDREEAFLSLMERISASRLLHVCLEFRTTRDANLRKETPSHFRRYIDSATFLSKVGKFGFDVSYFVEGFGYAKYGADDAHVARVILRVRNK